MLIAAPVWCQETTAEGVPAKASFDLASPAVKTALRNTVATQTGQYVLAPAKETEPAPDAAVNFVPPAPAPKPVEYPTSLPRPTAEPDDFLSFLVHALVNDVLLDNDDHVHDVSEHQDQRVACQARGDDLGSTTCERNDAAPRISR